jgi:hypothetical protein
LYRYIAIDLKEKTTTTTQSNLFIEDLDANITELVVLYREKESTKSWNVIKTPTTNITIQGLLPLKQYKARVVGYFNGKVYKSESLSIKTNNRK